MPSPTDQYFTINLKFPNMPKSQENLAYLDKFNSWIQEEMKSMPIKKIKFKRQQIILQSKDFFIGLHFEKQMELVLSAKKPRENLDQLNTICNKIFSYLNTTVPEGTKKVDVGTDLFLTEKGESDFAKKVIGDSRIAKISEIIKSQWSPFGILYEWKIGDRTHIAMVGSYGSVHTIALSSAFKWENGLPLDAITVEKEELLKFEESVEKIMKGEL